MVAVTMGDGRPFRPQACPASTAAQWRRVPGGSDYARSPSVSNDFCHLDQPACPQRKIPVGTDRDAFLQSILSKPCDSTPRRAHGSLPLLRVLGVVFR